MIIATIDIGTNTVLMLISECNNGVCKTIGNYFDIARLGEGVDNSKKISRQAIDRLTEILKRFKQKCLENNCNKIIVTGTSVFRDAINTDEVISHIQREIGLKINVLSGEQEAKYSFAGAVNSEHKSVLIDIGGGSTELAVGHHNDIKFLKSMDIGAVRITEKFFKAQPPTPDEITSAKIYIMNILNDELDKSFFNDIDFYFGVAGTVTTIAATILNTTDDDIEAYEDFTLKSTDLVNTYNNFINSTTSVIINKYKVHPKRADLISAGTLILLCLYEYLDLQKIKVSSKGLRYGILKYLDNFY